MESRFEWINQNACNFCKGSRGHSCAGYDCRDAAVAAGAYWDRINAAREPRFLLEKDSVCYGCEQYRHWAKTSDPYYFEVCDMDENGGVCDTEIPCFEGSLNTYRG